jgi:hypothetical protein
MSVGCRVGCRAITLQEPFASAMAHGATFYTRRGKVTTFPSTGEWIAIHAGQNSEHLKNPRTMAAVRNAWPLCPDDGTLASNQKHIVGVARFIDGAADATAAAKADAILATYPCSKSVAWRVDSSRPLPVALPYPKGQLQVWHVTSDGFTTNGCKGELLELLAACKSGKETCKNGEELHIKQENPMETTAKSTRVKRGPSKVQTKSTLALKSEQPVPRVKREAPEAEPACAKRRK